jgi:histidine triad (HIT) family protein
MEKCIFCKVVNKKVPARIIVEDDLAVAFEDVNPQAPIHVLVIPKMHISSLNEVTASERDLMGHLMLVAAKVAEIKSVHQTGYRLVINTNAQAGQTVFHVHFHVLGGRQMAWPPG